MAYKITKYRGKHKIKDTKTGKSVDIDIDKFMSGGTPEYENGVDFDCPEGDFECQERKRLMQQRQVARDKTMVAGANIKPFGTTNTNPNSRTLNDLYNQVGFSDTGITDENAVAQRREQVAPVSTLKSAGLVELPGAEITAPDISESLKSTMNDLEGGTTDTVNQNGDDIYQIANPYAGVDIPTAAYTLGQSIKNKNTLGIVGSGLKLATGLGRNVVSGLGQANRYNQVMEDYYKDQKDNKNPVQYLAHGGKKKDEDFATGEYMTGTDNENVHDYNSEVEDGEYFQSNEGDIAEVVGDKHTQGGEKIQMEAEDRVLSDQLKLGAKTAKELSKKYDIKLKAKNTYADVLDKYRKKSKLDKILEEEAELNKKIGEQDKVEDATTRNFNLDVLTKKKAEIAEQKHPIEEERKVIFDELFEIQEASKPKEERAEQPDLAFGGDLDSLAKEYNIPIERAQELVQNFARGGKMVPKYQNGIKVGDIDPVTGKKVTKEEAKKKVESGEWEDLGRGRYVDRGTPGSERVTGQTLQSYRQTWDKERFPKFEDYVDAAEQWKRDNPDWNKGQVEKIPGIPDQFFYTEESPITPLKARGIQPLQVDTSIQVPELNIPKTADISEVEEDVVIKDEEDIKRRNAGLAGMYLFPDESPLPPSSLQGTIKPERRFDRVRSTEIEVEPYLQDIRDREQSQVQSLEGLSPNVRAAVLANMRANNQSQESNVRNQIDTQNLQSKERAIYTNAQIQAREENASAADRLAYEQRQYRAQALTDNDLNNYYNQLQAVNKQRFMDISNLNLINATNEDVFFDGQSFRRKNSDDELFDRATRRYRQE